MGSWDKAAWDVRELVHTCIAKAKSADEREELEAYYEHIKECQQKNLWSNVCAPPAVIMERTRRAIQELLDELEG